MKKLLVGLVLGLSLCASQSQAQTVLLWKVFLFWSQGSQNSTQPLLFAVPFSSDGCSDDVKTLPIGKVSLCYHPSSSTLGISIFARPCEAGNLNNVASGQGNVTFDGTNQKIGTSTIKDSAACGGSGTFSAEAFNGTPKYTGATTNNVSKGSVKITRDGALTTTGLFNLVLKINDTIQVDAPGTLNHFVFQDPNGRRTAVSPEQNPDETDTGNPGIVVIRPAQNNVQNYQVPQGAVNINVLGGNNGSGQWLTNQGNVTAPAQ